MKNNKRRLSDNNTDSSELFTNTTKRKRVNTTSTSNEVCTNTSKRKRTNSTSSSHDVCNNTSKRKRPNTTSSAEACNTNKRKRTNSTSSSHEVCTNTTTSTTPWPNWSDIQPDLLELIFEKLPAEDAIRFPAVCHSWEVAAKSSVSSKCIPLRQQPPMLIFPSQDTSNRLFFSSSEKKVYNITKKFPKDEVLLWSHGWLLMCKRQYSKKYSMGTYLFNPLSGARIKLPPITDQNRMPVHRAAISADPSRNNNFIVVIVLKLGVDKTRMIFLKHGVDTRWKDLRWLHNQYECKVDVMLYEDQLFVVSSDHIVVWDFRGESDPTKTKDFPISGLMIERHLILTTYRVESQGEILFVKQVRGRYSDDLYVYRLNFGGRKWEKVESLTGRALFLDEKLSRMAISTRNFPALLEGNSIYYVALYEKPKKYGCDMAEYRILQYNLKDKKKPKLYEKFNAKEPKGSGDYLLCPWILPNPVLHGEKEAQIK